MIEFYSNRKSKINNNLYKLLTNSNIQSISFKNFNFGNITNFQIKIKGVLTFENCINFNINNIDANIIRLIHCKLNNLDIRQILDTRQNTIIMIMQNRFNKKYIVNLYNNLNNLFIITKKKKLFAIQIQVFI